MKQMAEIVGKTGAFAAGSMICTRFWTPRGRTEVILDPKKAPRGPPRGTQKTNDLQDPPFAPKAPPGDPPNITFKSRKRYNYCCFETWAILDASSALIDFHHHILMKNTYR